MAIAKVLIFAGSARKDSTNHKLATAAAKMATAAGAAVTLVNLADYPMPLYDGDLEASSGLPENAIKLKQLMIAHQAFIIASPEYNSSISPLLKNALDWASRVHEKDEPGLVAYRGKVAGLLSASPGGLGGLRGLVHLRDILGNIGMHVVPEQAAVGGAFDAFDTDGNLINESQRNMVNSVVSSVVHTTERLFS